MLMRRLMLNKKPATPEQQQSEAYAKENNKAEKAIEANEAAVNKNSFRITPILISA